MLTVTGLYIPIIKIFNDIRMYLYYNQTWEAYYICPYNYSALFQQYLILFRNPFTRVKASSYIFFFLDIDNISNEIVIHIV